MKGKRKTGGLILAGILIYFLLLFLLVLAESGAEGASITSLPLAFWYSITTFTTVGYGDTFPVTAAGRVIGFLFQLFSLGILAAALGLFLELLSGKLLPTVKLRLARRKKVYVMTDNTACSLQLAQRLREEEPACLILLPQSARSGYGHTDKAVLFTDLSPEAILRIHGSTENLHFFFLSDDSFENERKAAALSGLGVQLTCRSEREPEKIPPHTNYYNPCEGCARLYWHRFPVTKKEERIVLVGGGQFGEALLEQALMFNIIAPDQHIRYDLLGDWESFRRAHLYLDQMISLGKEEADRDSLFFHPGAWNETPDCLMKADRILFVSDDEAETASHLGTLLRYYPVPGQVYARFSEKVEGVVSFGSPEELYEPNLVLGLSLRRLAVGLHNNYLRSSGGALPSWEQLGGFLRRSNLASADHLGLKARILTGEDEPDFKKAAARYRTLTAEERKTCRRIEHLRWCRFHYLNNWQYAPIRDNLKRQHPLLVPFDNLSEADQAKDDYAWELLDQAESLTNE